MIDEAALDNFKMQAIARLRTAQSVYPWLDQPGDIIQCPPSALCKGDFYVMGFNPGGDGENKSRTLLQTTQALGAHPLEGWKEGWPNLCKLANRLVGDGWKDKLFITNLFPDPSPNIPKWEADHHEHSTEEYVSAIWPLHELMLAIVRPRFVIVHGIQPRKSAFWYLWHWLTKPANVRAAWNAATADETKDVDPSIKCFDMRNVELGDCARLPNLTFIGINHLWLPHQSNMDALKSLIEVKR